MLEDNVCLPSNGKLYTKVINWVQRSIWENGDSLEELMEQVSFKVNGIQQFLQIIFAITWRIPFHFYFITMTLKNLNFAIGTPKLRNRGGVQVSWMNRSVWSSAFLFFSFFFAYYVLLTFFKVACNLL